MTNKQPTKEHHLHLEPIGYITSDFKEKFATPRQPGLVTAAKGQLILQPPYNQADAVAGLNEFSHIWLVFGFHQTAEQGWKPKVRPPRLGGNAKLGVFATRSTFRPNPLGLSLVELEKVSIDKGVILHVKGADLIDGTPVYDIKPYLPWVESVPEASSGFAGGEQVLDLPITFAAAATPLLNDQLRDLIQQVLRHDPRPAYQQDPERIYGCHIQNVNVQWRVTASEIIVTDIRKAT